MKIGEAVDRFVAVATQYELGEVALNKDLKVTQEVAHSEYLLKTSRGKVGVLLQSAKSMEDTRAVCEVKILLDKIQRTTQTYLNAHPQEFQTEADVIFKAVSECRRQIQGKDETQLELIDDVIGKTTYLAATTDEAYVRIALYYLKQAKIHQNKKPEEPTSTQPMTKEQMEFLLAIRA